MLLRETQNIVGCNAIDNFGRGQRSRTTISQVSASTPVLIRRLVTAITGYFWEGSIKLSSWATPNNAESEFSEIEFNVFENTFLRIQEEPPPKSGGLFLCSKAQSPMGISPNARKPPSYFVRRHYLFVLPKRLSLKQGTHIETRSVVHRHTMFQSVFHRICRAAGSPCAIGDTIGRTID